MLNQELRDRLVARWSGPYPVEDATIVVAAGADETLEFHELRVATGRLDAWTCCSEPPDGWTLDLPGTSFADTLARLEPRPDLAAAASVSLWNAGQRVERRPIPPFDVQLPLRLCPTPGADVWVAFELTGSPWGSVESEMAVRDGVMVGVGMTAGGGADVKLGLDYAALCSYLAGETDVYAMLAGGVEIVGELDDLELVIGLIESDGAREHYRRAVSATHRSIAALSGLLSDSEARTLAAHDLRHWDAT